MGNFPPPLPRGRVRDGAGNEITQEIGELEGRTPRQATKTRSGRAFGGADCTLFGAGQILAVLCQPGEGGWRVAGFVPAGKNGTCPICLSEQIPDLSRARHRQHLGLGLALLVHAVGRQDVVRQHCSGWPRLALVVCPGRHRQRA